MKEHYELQSEIGRYVFYKLLFIGMSPQKIKLLILNCYGIARPQNTLFYLTTEKVYDIIF